MAKNQNQNGNKNQAPAQRESVILGTATVAELVAQKAISNISVVRENESGYKYVTVLSPKRDNDGNTQSTNVYFGKKSAETVDTGDKIAKEDLLEMKILVVSYPETDETRIKISTNSESEYTDLLADDDQIEIVKKALMAEYSSVTADVR